MAHFLLKFNVKIDLILVFTQSGPIAVILGTTAILFKFQLATISNYSKGDARRFSNLSVFDTFLTIRKL